MTFNASAASVAHDPAWTLSRSFKRFLNDAGPATEVAIGHRTIRLVDLLAGFFSHVRDELHLHSNAHPRKGEALHIAASVPANASSGQRILTVDAFRRAGFDVVALLNEPSAAGFEYAHRFRETVTSKREYVLVYDLGGGTFDASLIKMEGRANEVETSSGIARLGGDDFDEVILNLVESKIGPIAAPRELDLAAVGRHEPLVLPIDEVYAACAPLVQQTFEAMAPAMRDPRRELEGVDWSELAGLYVVGGASAFPPVYRHLREQFGAHRVRRSPHPFGSTAIGLAITLDQRAGYTLKERLTRHFGVFREESAGAEVSFDVLLPKDTRLPGPGEAPLTVTRRYRAAHNLGHFRFVECARIDSGRPEGNLALWDEVLFPFDPRLRAVRDLTSIPVARLPGDGPNVEETVRCDAAGELEVQLRVLEDGFSNTVRIARRGAR